MSFEVAAKALHGIRGLSAHDCAVHHGAFLTADHRLHSASPMEVPDENKAMKALRLVMLRQSQTCLLTRRRLLCVTGPILLSLQRSLTAEFFTSGSD
eukprot:s2320_g15.t2